MIRANASRAQTPQQDLSTPEVIQPAPLRANDPMAMASAMGNEAMKALLGGGGADAGGSGGGPLGDGGYASSAPPGDEEGAAIEATLASSRPKPLDGGLLGMASKGLGRGMGDVTVHEGAEVDQLLAELGMRALTWGTAILRTRAGAAEAVMLHELVHIAQHDGRAPTGNANVSTGAAGGQAESQADASADALLSGDTVKVARHTPAARGFAATAKIEDGERDRDAVCHENQTVDPAMDVGFSEDDAQEIYSGNWQRDMNQIVMPLFQPINPAIYEIFSIGHTKRFGTPLPSPKEFGTYDPVEHIDNPAGLDGRDAYKQNGDSASSTTPMGDKDQTLAALDQRYQDEATLAQLEANALDSTHDKVRGDRSDTNTGEVEELGAFQVDRAGIPMYLRASRTQLIQSLVGAVRLSREEGGRDRGLRMVGEALHIMQDYYAHSNFCEIGLNILLRERGTGRYDEQGREDANGRTLEEIFADSGRTLGDFNLDSLVHEISSDANGERVVHEDQNLTHQGREVMATGTFLPSDAVHSVKEKMLGMVEELNPFEETTPGPSEWTIATFNWLESNPVYVPGFDTSQLAGVIRAVGPSLRTVTDLAGGALRGIGTAANSIATGAGNMGGWVADKVSGGDADQGASGPSVGDRIRDAGRDAGSNAEQGLTSAAESLDQLNQSLEALAVGVESMSLAELYSFAYAAVSPWLRLSTWVRLIPGVGDAWADKIKQAEDAVRQLARELLSSLWEKALLQIIAEADALASAAVGTTEVTGKNGPSSMTQPTHTDIAKDFDSDNHGAHEVESVIEETIEEVFEALDLDKDRDLDDPHQHQHRHGGAWLAGLADSMAHASSAAILGVVRGQMDGAPGPDGEVQTAMSSVVNDWMSHPEDCRGTWTSTFMATLQAQDASTEELLDEISRRTAKPPSAQAPNMHQTSDGATPPPTDTTPSKQPQDDDHDADHGHGKNA